MNRNQWVHPEIMPGECFFSNMTANQFESFSLDSKRRGFIAFNGDGEQLEMKNWFPVFVGLSELTVIGSDLNQQRVLWRDLFESQPRAA